MAHGVEGEDREEEDDETEGRRLQAEVEVEEASIIINLLTYHAGSVLVP